MHIAHNPAHWFADIVNYLVTDQMPLHWGQQDKLKFLSKVKTFLWDDPYLFKYCPDQIIRRCIPEFDQTDVISFCHDHACLLTLVLIALHMSVVRNSGVFQREI
jgi:hypothetical protein